MPWYAPSPTHLQARVSSPSSCRQEACQGDQDYLHPTIPAKSGICACATYEGGCSEPDWHPKELHICSYYLTMAKWQCEHHKHISQWQKTMTGGEEHNFHLSSLVKSGSILDADSAGIISWDINSSRISSWDVTEALPGTLSSHWPRWQLLLGDFGWMLQPCPPVTTATYPSPSKTCFHMTGMHGRPHFLSRPPR